MKTLTITVSDKTSEKLANHAAENGKSTEEWASWMLEDAYDDEWLNDLSPEDRASLEQAFAEADRGETIPHEQVVEEMRRKFGP
jgi:predicted transcriptional regulator